MNVVGLAKSEISFARNRRRMGNSPRLETVYLELCCDHAIFPFIWEGSLPVGEKYAVSSLFLFYFLFSLKGKMSGFWYVRICSLDSPFLKVVIWSLAVGYGKQFCGFLCL